ncbi:UDP-glycosyltransferase UGT5-like [Schistocerca serialis cubense]|uniref:UDP-glycosyltransferase UGT5-like n=1 Tax=Schistocerca serialis cubense TaxID=2023355 RepID=UPI00214E21C7|nr:UDP-glycosyltransferase UGT5-like [Schistocerca serialis cubense]
MLAASLAAALLVLAAAPAQPANILAPIWFQARSHFAAYEPLFRALAARGHNVTVLSHYPQPAPLANYHDISLAGSAPLFTNNVPVELVLALSSPAALSVWMWRNGTQLCRDLYALPQVQQLLRSDDHYDLVIAEVFFGDCVLALAHKFRAPLVGVISSEALPWAHDRVGNPEHPAYSQTYFSSGTPPFSFWQRLVHSVGHVAARLGYWLCSDLEVDAVVREALGEGVPPTAQLSRRTSLLLANSHWSLGQPLPAVPALVHVAGMHIQPPQPLPQDVKMFLDGSPQGAIFFSLGSMIQCESFAKEKLRALLDVFSELPQRVLWKVNAASLPPLPPNVMARSWFPQNDVLNHPNVRVFITHAGMLGLLEAVNASVPMLAIPFFGDQPSNAATVVAAGNALQLPYGDLDYQTFRDTLGELLNNERYRESAKRQSILFRDRPRPPLEEAVYWVEYVIRHQGAPHLRSAALDLAWYQYLLLDVAAFVVAVALLLMLAIYWLLRRVKYCITSESVDGRKLKMN